MARPPVSSTRPEGGSKGIFRGSNSLDQPDLFVSSHRQESIDLLTRWKVSVGGSKGYGSELELIWDLEHAL